MTSTASELGALLDGAGLRLSGQGAVVEIFGADGQAEDTSLRGPRQDCQDDTY